MSDKNIPFFGTHEYDQQHLNELLKNPPQPVNFTYTIDQLKAIYANFTPTIDNNPAPNYIEDYYWYLAEHSEKKGDVSKVVNSIYEFYLLEDKNDINRVNDIYNTIYDNIYGIQLPNEYWKVIDKINAHKKYLCDMKFLDDYKIKEQEQKLKEKELKEQEMKKQQTSSTEAIDNFFKSINGVNQNNNPKPSETYVTLEELEPLLSESGYMCYGHGIGRKGNSEEVVDSIFKEGLRTKNNSLYYTTVGLSTPTPELKAQLKEIGMQEPTIENLKREFNNWQHLNSRKIIIARIPTEYINKTGDRSDLDGEMFGAFYTQKTQPNGQKTNYLAPKFIIGCFDVDKQTVRLNKKFEKNLTSESIEKLKENYKKTVAKTNARKERQALGITQEEINLALRNQTQPVNYNTEVYDVFDNNIEWNNTSSEQEEINKLKEQISEYNNQINTLLQNFQPYMQIPKVNREISNVIKKNNDLDSSQMLNSLSDYKEVVETKQYILSYLEKADKFIKDNVGKQQAQNSNQSIDSNSNNEYEQLIEELNESSQVNLQNQTPEIISGVLTDFEQRQENISTTNTTKPFLG